MAHNAYRKSPAGNWAGVTVLLDADMSWFDQLLFKQVNGDDGGTWAPTTPITIGGAGIYLEVGTHSLAAGATFFIDAGGEVQFLQGEDLVFESGFPSFGATHAARDHFVALAAGDIVKLSPLDDYWAIGPLLQVTSLVAASPSGTPRGAFTMSIPALDGATLKSVTLTATPGSSPTHASVPTFPPEFDVLRVDPSLSTVQSLLSTGPKVFSAGDVPTYEALLLETATCDQNNVIDRASWFYIITVKDEYDGVPGVTRAGFVVKSVELVWDVPDLRPY